MTGTYGIVHESFPFAERSHRQFLPCTDPKKAYIMPFLTLRVDRQENMSSPFPLSRRQSRSESPLAPPYSPITPELSSATLAPAPLEQNGAFNSPAVQRPPLSMPISESDNVDALALRCAASVLQFQRLRALRDLKTLERQKAAAMADPERFVTALASGKIKTATQQNVLVSTTSDRSGGETQQNGHGEPAFGTAAFGNIPAPQTIVRYPPINWAKYGVVGEALDKLHEEQQTHPAPAEPQRDMEAAKATEHVIAAPYRAWTDQLPASPVKTRGGGKNRL